MRRAIVENDVIVNIVEAPDGFSVGIECPPGAGIGWVRVDGVWEAPPPVALSQEAIDAIIAEKIEALWQAADRYTSSYISGVAIGILTIGVMQQKPKALAVSAWSSAVWAEYYVRKALVTATSTDDHDFSGFGPIPHSVPELQAEVGL